MRVPASLLFSELASVVGTPGDRSREDGVGLRSDSAGEARFAADQGSRLFAYRHPEAFATLISNSTCPAVRLSLAAEKGSVPSETFNVMERRLLRGIINPGDDCGERSSSNPLDFSDTRPMERRDESSEETSLQRQQIPRYRGRRQNHVELWEKSNGWKKREPLLRDIHSVKV
jgi:hypothetical protein